MSESVRKKCPLLLKSYAKDTHVSFCLSIYKNLMYMLYKILVSYKCCYFGLSFPQNEFYKFVSKQSVEISMTNCTVTKSSFIVFERVTKFTSQISALHRHV